MVHLIWYPGNGNKKYTVSVIFDDGMYKNVSFGDRRYAQYMDRSPLGLYSHMNHLDDKRRRIYRRRHSKITNRDGVPAYMEKFSPAWFSWHYLW